jgi:hypothetical protein
MKRCSVLCVLRNGYALHSTATNTHFIYFTLFRNTFKFEIWVHYCGNGVQPIRQIPFRRKPFRRKPIRRKIDSAKVFLAKGVSAKTLKCYLHMIHEFYTK